MAKRNERRTDKVVYTKYITLRNGKRIYAATYGLEAFCFIPRTRHHK